MYIQKSVDRRRFIQASVKPIFHCNAKAFAFGRHIGFRPPTRAFSVGDTNMLVS